jgi:hypothetical protein
MLKKFDELYKIDVMPFCDLKDGKDDKGKPIKIPYLNWAKCVTLLHENGAETVYFTPVKNAEGGYLFSSREVHNKDGRTTGCYFVSVEVHIDDLVFTQDLPLLNGNLVVYDDTLNQLRISNAHARAFVKGVAIRTGLGFSLWAEDDEGEKAMSEDLSIHNILKIKQRIEQRFTELMKRGMSQAEICEKCKLKEKDVGAILGKYMNGIIYLEDALKKL